MNWQFKYLYGDPHFWHKNVIPYCNRPWADREAMNEGLIKRYNSVVGPEDTVLWLGDCFFCGTTKAKEIMERLNGKKVLILGNHDNSATKMMKLGFEWACLEMVARIGGHTCRFSHFPYRQSFWSKLFNKYDDRYERRRPLKKEGEILIHGHIHEAWKVRDNMINVGCDVWDWKPVSTNTIVKLITKIKKAD